MEISPRSSTREVVSHWITLLTGVVVGLLGFGSHAADVAVPRWVSWAAALILLAVAQFKAWRSLRAELDARAAADSVLIGRAERLRLEPALHNETFHVWEVLGTAVPDSKAIVSSRRFEGCTIRGPGVVVLLGPGAALSNCRLDAPPEQLTFEVRPSDIKVGLIGS